MFFLVSSSFEELYFFELIGLPSFRHALNSFVMILVDCLKGTLSHAEMFENGAYNCQFYLFIYFFVLMIAYGKECASLCNIMIFQTLVYIDLSEDQDD